MTTHADTLTGLQNRTALDTMLRQSLEEQESVGLALVDLDYFREVNDSFGMEAGDQVLRSIAGLLTESAPGRVYRIGGDEFAIVMPETSLEQAFLQMERIRARVEAAQLPNIPEPHHSAFASQEQRQITITVGVAQYPRDAKDIRGLMSAASAALLSAKENNRNQVALPSNEDMVMKSCYYPASSLRKLKALAERLNRKESRLLREALEDLFRKYKTPGEQ